MKNIFTLKYKFIDNEHIQFLIQDTEKYNEEIRGVLHEVFRMDLEYYKEVAVSISSVNIPEIYIGKDFVEIYLPGNVKDTDDKFVFIRKTNFITTEQAKKALKSVLTAYGIFEENERKLDLSLLGETEIF